MVNSNKLFRSTMPWIIALMMSLVTYCDNSPERTKREAITDQVTIFFHEGITLEKVNAINAEIGATIVGASAYTPTYRMQLPQWVTLDDAFAYYKSKPEVELVLLATNLHTN